MRVSVIIPTIGRPESLLKLLESLLNQSIVPDEVIIADGSGGNEIREIVADRTRKDCGVSLRYLGVSPPNAVNQRKLAIKMSHGSLLLLLDDDVVLEPDCLKEMIRCIESDRDVVAVMADFNNQTWSAPTKLWRAYLFWFCGLKKNQWQGKVVGPLLRFGYHPPPTQPARMEWLGSGMSLIKRPAYDQSGGFSDFFLHRCTMNEDVDLGIKLSRIGRILLCPSARLAHFHAPAGRMSPRQAAEDDLYNRFFVMRITQVRTWADAFSMVVLFFLIETASSGIGCIRRLNVRDFVSLTVGRLCALLKILTQR